MTYLVSGMNDAAEVTPVVAVGDAVAVRCTVARLMSDGYTLVGVTTREDHIITSLRFFHLRDGKVVEVGEDEAALRAIDRREAAA